MSGSIDVERFYQRVLHALGEHARRGGTGIGAAAVVKRIGRECGVEAADRIPVPRLTRERRATIAWEQGR